jgi:FAD/FMN-containing dehydrogenase
MRQSGTSLALSHQLSGADARSWRDSRARMRHVSRPCRDLDEDEKGHWRMTDIGALRASLAGTVSAPGDPGWDLARQAFILSLDQRPDLVAVPADAADVARVAGFAGQRGLRVAAQLTGHGASSLGDLKGTVLLRTSAMTGVQIDAGRRRARVAAGARWQDVVPAASELGLAALHGSSGTVGVAGYSLGGGVGWYARKLGLQASSVTAVELVTADGRLVRADREREPGLFWALRGGGGSFGVVTALEFALYPAEEVYAGALFFPFERAAEVLHAWREWTASVPEELTSVGRLLQFPPAELIPEPFRGRSFAVVEAACLGTGAASSPLLGPLRRLGPQLDTFAAVPPAALLALHMDPPDPVPYVGGDAMLADLPAAAIDELISVAGPGSGSPLLSVELRHLGGAAARPQPGHGALAALDGSVAVYSVGFTPDPHSGAAIAAQLAKISAALAPYQAGRRYYNLAETEVDPSEFFDRPTLDRLRRVKAEYDPGNLFRARHEIGPRPGPDGGQ